MIFNFFKSRKQPDHFKIRQSNVFYNYSMGLNIMDIDLLKAGKAILKLGLAQSVFFSDKNFIYCDKNGDQHLKFRDRQEDIIDSLSSEDSSILQDYLIFDDLVNDESHLHSNQEDYLRVSLSPIVLEDEVYGEYIINVLLKIYSNGIAILSFQFDAHWDDLDESGFIEDVINLYSRSWDKVWVDKLVQKIDGEVYASKQAFGDIFVFAGNDINIKGREKIIRKMQKNGLEDLEKALHHSQGKEFSFDDKNRILHLLAGTNDQKTTKAFELCVHMYFNIVAKIIDSISDASVDAYTFIWEGRPSVSLMCFSNQPKNRQELEEKFSNSIRKILNRSSVAMDESIHLKNLRWHGDYSFYGNRSVLLWIKLNSKNSYDENTLFRSVLSHQARVEQIEFYNMLFARACAWCADPETEEHLFNAYDILINKEKAIHQSSQSGEIVQTINYLMDQFGINLLIKPAKESAVFHLDELKYRSDLVKSRKMQWMTLTFGLVGATSFAEFIVYPLVKNWCSEYFRADFLPLLSFFSTLALIGVILGITSLINKNK